MASFHPYIGSCWKPYVDEATQQANPERRCRMTMVKRVPDIWKVIGNYCLFTTMQERRIHGYSKGLQKQSSLCGLVGEENYALFKRLTIPHTRLSSYWNGSCKFRTCSYTQQPAGFEFQTPRVNGSWRPGMEWNGIEQKLRLVTHLKQMGKVVAMTGDGVTMPRT